MNAHEAPVDLHLFLYLYVSLDFFNHFTCFSENFYKVKALGGLQAPQFLCFIGVIKEKTFWKNIQ
jgi:hypothetical protein